MDARAGGAPVSRAPATTADVASCVRDAAARRMPLRVAGSGGWLDAGRPVRDAEPLLLYGLDGIVEYVPGDLTLTARAGTTLAAIERATAAAGQFLPLDPYGKRSATIGATIATASAGPMAHAFGTPRDIVLGVEAVDGRGTILRGGGRVVKNVAGFDLTRLLTGAWGTLGVITEVSVRLRALPQTDETVAFALGANHREIAALIHVLHGATIAPWTLELLSPAIAVKLGVAHRTVAVMRLAGNDESVAAQRAALLEVGEVSTIDGSFWRRLRECDPADAAVLRASRVPSKVSELWSAARGITEAWPGAYAHASLGRGVVRVVLPGADDARTTAALNALGSAGARCIAERVPPACWEHPVLASAAADPLSRRARDAFDPQRVLNPGLLGGDA